MALFEHLFYLWRPVKVSKKSCRKKFFLVKILKFQKIFFFKFFKKKFSSQNFVSLIFFCVVNENHFTNASNTNRLLFANFFQHRNILSCILAFYCIILCLFLEIPKNHDFSQKILIFTYDPKKYKLWVKVCEFALKIVVICFKSVSDNCFWIYYRKKVNKTILKSAKIWSFFGKIWKKHDFLMDFFLTPPIFRPKTDKQPKNSGQLPDISKILPKKILVGIAQKLTQKIQKVDPPLFGPKRGGLFLKYDLIYVFYWAW